MLAVCQEFMTRVTFTGIDERTPLESLPPDVELGVLYTKDPACRPRYPSRDDTLRILGTLHQQGRQTALHVCGLAAREQLICGALEDLLAVTTRVQVNGRLTVDELRGCVDACGGRTVITQHTVRNAELRNLTWPQHALLVDDSGGRGITPAVWVRPSVPAGKRVGFAGGLGPATIDQSLRTLYPMLGDGWIDMESGLRGGGGWFDTDRAWDVFRRISTIVSDLAIGTHES